MRCYLYSLWIVEVVFYGACVAVVFYYDTFMFRKRMMLVLSTT